MAMKRAYYRATSLPFLPGDPMASGSDHIDDLRLAVRAGEERLRKLRPDLADLRATSLYLFADKETAIRYWALSGGDRHLYEVEA
jgi:hypothetical protein